jgi:hypothetical protein
MTAVWVIEPKTIDTITISIRSGIKKIRLVGNWRLKIKTYPTIPKMRAMAKAIP